MTDISHLFIISFPTYLLSHFPSVYSLSLMVTAALALGRVTATLALGRVTATLAQGIVTASYIGTGQGDS